MIAYAGPDGNHIFADYIIYFQFGAAFLRFRLKNVEQSAENALAGRIVRGYTAKQGSIDRGALRLVTDPNHRKGVNHERRQQT